MDSNIYSAFKHALFNPEENHTDFLNALDEESGHRGLNIYQYAYTSRLQESLQSDYPQLYAFLGEDNFSSISIRYIKHHPSHFFSLRDFGKYLPDFLQRDSKTCNDPYLAELAQFEFLLLSAFDAADTPVLTEKQLRKVAPEHWPKLCFKLHPSVKFFKYRWNTLPLWKALKQGLAPPKPKEISNPEHCLIWREQYSCHHKTLDPTEFTTLAALDDGRPFEYLCSQLESHFGEKSAYIMAQYLRAWISSGLLISPVRFHKYCA